MKEKVAQIISNYTDVFGFVSCNDYKAKRTQLNKDDHFNDYSVLVGYKTIVTLGFPYPSKEVKWRGKGYGIFARFSYSNDYHVVIMNMLEEIITKLNDTGIKGIGRVDVNKVDEKFAGSLSGVGYFGKNSILIHPTYGSYMFLATILIDKELNNSHKLDQDCGECDLCIKACPTNALDNGFIRDKCISNLSQTKKEFSLDEISQFKTMIYGCDICIKVCPKNKGIDTHKYSGFEPNGIENVKLIDILNMNNKAFKEYFGGNTAHWIGAAQMKRNAICLMANQKLVEHIPKIRETMTAYTSNLWYNKTARKVLEILESEVKE